MTQTITGDIGIAHLLVGGLLLLFLITRLAWWAGKLFAVLARAFGRKAGGGIYFPSREFCQWVHKNAPKWRRRAIEWITAIPPRISVIGFLSSLLWPVVVLLNLLLLAQVLEMYFPSDIRVTIPYFGSYAVFPLLMGLLFSIAQSMFALVAGETHKKSIATLFIMFLILTICVEMRLAAERASVLEAGEAVAGATVTDRVMSQGMLMAAFVAFVVPVAHSVLGFLALPRFILPGIGYVVRLVLALVLWVWALFASFFFGFHDTPITLPPAVANLWKKAKRLLHDADVSVGKVAQQEINVGRLVEMQEPFSKMLEKAAVITAEAHATREDWKKKLKEIAVASKEAESVEQCEEVAQRLCELSAGVVAEPPRISTDAGQLDDRLRNLPAAVQDWDAHSKPLETSLPALKAEVTRREALLREAEEERLNLIVILKPAKRPAEQAPAREFEDPLEKQLSELRERAMSAPDPYDRQWALKEHAQCLEILCGEVNNDLREAESRLEGLTHRISKLEIDAAEAAKNPPQHPDPALLEAARNGLSALKREMITAAKETRRQIEKLEKAISRKRRGIEREMTSGGPRRRFWLLEFFAWIGHTFSEMIDFVMGVNQDLDGKPKNTGMPSPQ